jgi:putative glutamine amidotransferase
VIGISSYARDGSPPAFSLPCGYVDGVRAAGAMPLILPPGQPDPAQLLDVINGLVLAGGGDIAPAAYGGEPHETIYLVSEERDQFEFALTRAALARRDLPLLCICRGMQVLNVVCGGTLHAHLPDRFGETVEHRLPPRRPARHAVRIDRGSRLARILGTTDASVCSWHHQAIDQLGAGLRPVGWAADGVIEAVEHTSHQWCIGVQWHPEMEVAEASQHDVFAALVAAARAKGREGRAPTDDGKLQRGE